MVGPVVLSETSEKIDEEAVLVTNSSILGNSLLKQQSNTSCVFIENNQPQNLLSESIEDNLDGDNEEVKGYERLIRQSERESGCGKISKADFTMIKVIGKGSYGKVLLVKKKDSGKLYAMKVLKKTFIRQKKQIKNTMTERKILERINHPFIVKMNFAF